MRHFVVSYSSKNNSFVGQMYVSAATISDAQTKFLKWLQDNPTYTHLWSFAFEFKEIEGCL